MALNLSKTVVDFLKSHQNEKFTARDIAEWIFANFPEECREKKERSTATVTPITSDKLLIQQFVAEIGSQRSRLVKIAPQIKTTEGRPRKYYFSTNSDEVEIQINNTQKIKNEKSKPEFNEHELYQMLSEFLWNELNIYSKRIDEKRSSNKHGSGGNKWLFPDLVGVEDLSQDWHSEIKSIVKSISDQKTKFWSFEVKKIINRSNVRESYFQAVSNSSWANFGYLVAAEIENAEKELRMLCALHGIGLIKIDVESPSDSEILIPAREKSEIDWNNANRLAEENSDFLEYLKIIRRFYNNPNDGFDSRDWDYEKID